MTEVAIAGQPNTFPEPRKFMWDERLSKDDRPFIDLLNRSLERLDGSRAVEITPSGHFAQSKIAWKLAWYQHVLLHRIVALVDATAVSWNSRCTLGAMLSARAFMETVAVFAEFRKNIGEKLGAEDLGGLDSLGQHGLFATRDELLISERPEIKAKNILTYVGKFDDRVSGFAVAYDALSERCHPNSSGHTYMFSALDRTDGTVRFTNERRAGQNAQFILGALSALPLVPPWMEDLDRLILQVAELQNRVAPVRQQPEKN